MTDADKISLGVILEEWRKFRNLITDYGVSRMTDQREFYDLAMKCELAFRRILDEAVRLRPIDSDE